LTVTNEAKRNEDTVEPLVRCAQRIEPLPSDTPRCDACTSAHSLAGLARELEREQKHALGHLRGLLGMLGPCERFDYHGYCQSHFVESPCRVAKAREFLEAMSNAKNQGQLPRKGTDE
jgi:hypothetical protein